MKSITFFALSLLILSCSEKTSSKQTSFIKDEPINVSFLNGSESIDGCGEYIIDIKDTIGSQKYLFVSNLSEFGIINLDGKKRKLYRDTIESKLINDKEYVSVYKNNQYKVILNLLLKEAHDEGGIYKGKMIITRTEKNVKKSVEKTIHGECGC